MKYKIADGFNARNYTSFQYWTDQNDKHQKATHVKAVSFSNTIATCSSSSSSSSDGSSGSSSSSNFIPNRIQTMKDRIHE